MSHVYKNWCMGEKIKFMKTIGSVLKFYPEATFFEDMITF